MKIYRDIQALSQLQLPQTAVALGLFDGVHLGHRAVIQAAVKQAANGLTPAVFTFSTHHAIPSSKGKLSYICTDADRLAIFEAMGVEIVFMPEFEAIQAQTAADFVQKTLRNLFHAKFVSCGFNFHFGAYGVGDTDVLNTQCAKAGIAVEVIDPMTLDGDTISSTRIRKLLQEGDLTTANDLLGEPYFISGTVQHGFAIGHTIGFPTANQEIAANRVVLRHGVYATITEYNGKCYRSVTNIGIKPTIAGDRQPLAETYIIGLEEELYDKSIKVSFLDFQRPEQKFENLDALKAQITADKQNRLQYQESSCRVLPRNWTAEC